MTVQAGTITGVSLVTGNPAGAGLLRGYLLAVNFPAYVGATDTFTIAGVSAAITAKTHKAGTNALVATSVPVCVGAGVDTNGQLVYIGACTISTDALNGNLNSDLAGTEIVTSTACNGIQLFVPVVQSQSA